jgi:hypothetical protein
LFAINFLLAHANLIETALLERLQLVNMDYQVATSLNIVAAYIALELNKQAKLIGSQASHAKSISLKLFYALLPWMNHYHHAGIYDSSCITTSAAMLWLIRLFCVAMAVVSFSAYCGTNAGAQDLGIGSEHVRNV